MDMIFSFLFLRPKPIPMTEKIPAFPRLPTVVNFRSSVRGRLVYGDMSSVRDTLKREREKVLEMRAKVMGFISGLCYTVNRNISPLVDPNY